MLARSRAQRPGRAPRGEVFRVETPQPEPGGLPIPLSPAWRDALTGRRARRRPGGSWRGGRAGFRPGHAAGAGASGGAPPRADPLHAAPRTRGTSRPGWRCGRRSSASPETTVLVRGWTGCPPGAERLRDLVLATRRHDASGDPAAASRSR